MAGEKHPISYLQEQMQKSHKPLPHYDILHAGSGFECTVFVDDITASAISTSKQAAKLEAATKAVAILKAQTRPLFARPVVCKVDVTRPRSTAPWLQHMSEDSSPCTLDTPDKNLDTDPNSSLLCDSNSLLESTSSFSSINSNDQPSPQCVVTTTSALMTKHPISELQELLVGSRKVVPNYVITDLSTPHYPNFRCTLEVEKMTFSAEASAKQIARKEVAQQALDYLKGCPGLLSFKASTSVSVGEMTSNPIGSLNEYLQGKRLRLANYQEMGMNTSGEFIISCTVGDKTAQGTGANKKLAKKTAAHNMIRLLNINGSRQGPSVTPVKPQIPIHTRTDEEVLEKYKQLTIKSSSRLFSDSEPDCEEFKNLNVSDKPKSEIPRTEEELRNYLNDLDIPYQCSQIQEVPPIVRVAFKDSCNSTVLGMGATHEEATLDALKQAYQMFDGAKK